MKEKEEVKKENKRKEKIVTPLEIEIKWPHLKLTTEAMILKINEPMKKNPWTQWTKNQWTNDSKNGLVKS